MPANKRIGDILIERGVIDDATAELIEAERLLTRSRFLSAAVSHGRVSEADALGALAVREGVPAVDLARAIIATGVIRRVPLAVARQHVLLPVREEVAQLAVVMADPHDSKVLDELAFATGMQVLPHAALYGRLIEAIPRAYAATQAYYRGPLAPADAPEREQIPIVTDAPSLSAAADIEVVLDTDVQAIDVEPGDVAPARAPSAASPAPAAGGRKVVLVVEDEPEIARLIATTIAALGHEVVTAGRGLEALRLIKERRPSLIVLDAMLPEVHGFEICRKVKESKRFGATPVLMVSAIYRGWRMAEDIKATYKADAFLEKPFRVGDLRRVAQQLLDHTSAPGGDDEPLGAEAQRLTNEAHQALAVGDAVKALELLRRVESVEPFSAGVQFLIAQALEKHDRALQAIYHYERAIELRPSFFAAARQAAALYQSRGFRHKAAEMWERALAVAPTAEVRAQIKQHLMSLL